MHRGIGRFARFAGLAAVLAALVLTSTALASTTKSTYSGGVATGPSTSSSSSSTTYGPTLRMGSRGRWVSVLQQDLSFAGYSTPVSGVYGSVTRRSVISFKRAHGLSATALVQRATWRALSSAVQAIEASVPAGGTARLNPTGLVSAPANAPAVIQQVIAAANQIATTPYCYGGGHASFKSSCYDCSGSVSYALRGGGLLSVTEDSSEFESYGAPGPGRWITIYANAGHAYMKVAGLWYDTAAQSSSNGQDRWSRTRISSLSGFVVRHPIGY